MRAFLQASASSFLASNSTLFLCGPDLLLRPLYFSDWSLVDLGYVVGCSGGVSGLDGTLVAGI